MESQNDYRCNKYSYVYSFRSISLCIFVDKKSSLLNLLPLIVFLMISVSIIIGLKRKNPQYADFFFGGRRGARTPDPLGVNEML